MVCLLLFYHLPAIFFSFFFFFFFIIANRYEIKTDWGKTQQSTPFLVYLKIK